MQLCERLDNSADYASGGLDPRKDPSNSRCFFGPVLLQQRKEVCPSSSEVDCVGVDDPKIKKDVKVNAVQLVNDVLVGVEKGVSEWCKLKRIIAIFIH